VGPHVDAQVVQAVGGFSARRARVPAASGVHRAEVLRESAAVRESPAAAPADVRLRPGVPDLVRTKPLLRFEGLAALCTHMTGRHLSLVDYLMSIQG